MRRCIYLTYITLISQHAYQTLKEPFIAFSCNVVLPKRYIHKLFFLISAPLFSTTPLCWQALIPNGPLDSADMIQKLKQPLCCWVTCHGMNHFISKWNTFSLHTLAVNDRHGCRSFVHADGWNMTYFENCVMQLSIEFVFVCLYGCEILSVTLVEKQ